MLLNITRLTDPPVSSLVCFLTDSSVKAFLWLVISLSLLASLSIALPIVSSSALKGSKALSFNSVPSAEAPCFATDSKALTSPGRFKDCTLSSPVFRASANWFLTISNCALMVSFSSSKPLPKSIPSITLLNPSTIWSSFSIENFTPTSIAAIKSPRRFYYSTLFNKSVFSFKNSCNILIKESLSFDFKNSDKVLSNNLTYLFAVLPIEYISLIYCLYK